jgi:non-specific serine/threonine protein kinase
LRIGAHRHVTLRGTLAWSHDLLEPAEQVLFRRLSVFAGGWTLEPAEAVCSGDDPPVHAMLEGLAGLADHSRIQRASDADGELRLGSLKASVNTRSSS